MIGRLIGQEPTQEGLERAPGRPEAEDFVFSELVLPEYPRQGKIPRWQFGWHSRFITLCRYGFSEGQTWWKPSYNIQIDFGIAINWLGVRLRVSLRPRRNSWTN